MKIKIKNIGPKTEPHPEKETKLKVRLPIPPRPKSAATTATETKTPNIKIKLGGPKPKVVTKPTPVKARVPRIRVKPTRIPGEGYDSEDSEIEDDPLVEEAIVLRMLPDAELDYVRHCVESGDLSGISIRWKDRRRCWVYVNNTMYVAKLMRLPNIVEASKTVDKKNIFKAVDITEILVVLKRIQNEDEINDVSPDEEEYHSGITAPMKNITKSQYRRELTRDRIEAIEARVDELLRMDEEAMQSTYELVDPDSIGVTEDASAQTSVPSRMIDEEESAANFLQASREQEQRAINQEQEEQEEINDGIDDLELELEQALEGEDEEEDDDDDDDDDDDEDNSDNEAGMRRKVEVDEDEQHNALLRDEINELETTIQQNQARLDRTSNALLRDRFISSIAKLEKELENKKRQLRIGEDKTGTKKQQDDDLATPNTASAANTSTMGQDMDDDDDDDDDDGDMDMDMDDEPEGEDDGGLFGEGDNESNEVDIDDADFQDLFG